MDHKELVERITHEVMKRLEGEQQRPDEAPAGTGAPEPRPSSGTHGQAVPDSGLAVVEIPKTPSEVAQYIDHTLLKPDALEEQFAQLCDEAVKHRFYSVCVNSSMVAYCAKRLQGTDVKVCAVVGFPLGAMAGRAKNFEARHAIEEGAREIDMVINVGALKSGRLGYVEDDIRWVRRACPNNVVLKVIIEAALLTDEEKVIACRIAQKAGADFVKTSTGFSLHGATPHDVALMRRTVGPKTGVKAAGGVRSFEDAVTMIREGANRLGTSAGVKIVTGETSGSAY